MPYIPRELVDGIDYLEDVAMSEQERSDRYGDAIKRLQAHLVRDPQDHTFRLTIEDGDSIGIDPVIFADLKRSLEEMNKLIRTKAVDPEEVEFIP